MCVLCTQLTDNAPFAGHVGVLPAAARPTHDVCTAARCPAPLESELAQLSPGAVALARGCCTRRVFSHCQFGRGGDSASTDERKPSTMHPSTRVGASRVAVLCQATPTHPHAGTPHPCSPWQQGSKTDPQRNTALPNHDPPPTSWNTTLPSCHDLTPIRLIVRRMCGRCIRFGFGCVVFLYLKFLFLWYVPIYSTLSLLVHATFPLPCLVGWWCSTSRSSSSAACLQLPTAPFTKPPFLYDSEHHCYTTPVSPPCGTCLSPSRCFYMELDST